MESVLLPFFAAFVLWLGFRIVQKAGLDGWWVLALLVPYANIIMVWVFAFCRWPKLSTQMDDPNP